MMMVVVYSYRYLMRLRYKSSIEGSGGDRSLTCAPRVRIALRRPSWVFSFVAQNGDSSLPLTKSQLQNKKLVTRTGTVQNLRPLPWGILLLQ